MAEKRILVVEDSPTQAQMVRMVLRREGYRVLLAADGPQALELFQTEDVDLVLLDLNLPGKPGLDVCREIKKTGGTEFTPVIIVTDRSDVDSKVKGLRVGADDYLPKPFDTGELLARTRAMLRIKETEDRARQMAVTDELTGLYTRRFLSRRLAEELAGACRHRVPVGCILLNVDQLDEINDRLGHDFGDLVLRTIAQSVREGAREEDIVAHCGRGVFAVVLRNAKVDGCRTAAENLRTRVDDMTFRQGDTETRITVSCGVASYPESVTQISAESLLQAAESALFTAMERGRDCTVTYQPPVEG